MTRIELRLELIRIVHSAHRDHKQTLDIVHDYEADFDALLGDGQTASEPAAAAEPKPAKRAKV